MEARNAKGAIGGLPVNLQLPHRLRRGFLGYLEYPSEYEHLFLLTRSAGLSAWGICGVIVLLKSLKTKLGHRSSL
jgi:hypothetical protein